jgi:hypothetical protein
MLSYPELSDLISLAYVVAWFKIGNLGFLGLSKPILLLRLLPRFYTVILTSAYAYADVVVILL